jgi:hypothetical protein
MKKSSFSTFERVRSSSSIRRQYKNVSKSGLAKLCLNSLRGKLTESSNRPQKKTITDPQELYRFPATPGVEVANLLLAGDEVVLVTWMYVADEENMPVLRHTNEVIGA